MAEEESTATDVASLRSSLFSGPGGLNVLNLVPGRRPSNRRSKENLSEVKNENIEGILQTNENVGKTVEGNDGSVDGKPLKIRDENLLNVGEVEQNGGDGVKRQDGVVLESLCKRRVKRQGARPPSRAFRKSVCLLDTEEEALKGLEDIIQNNNNITGEVNSETPEKLQIIDNNLVIEISIPVIEVSPTEKQSLEIDNKITESVKKEQRAITTPPQTKAKPSKSSHPEKSSSTDGDQQTQNPVANKQSFERDLERKLSNKTTNEDKLILSTKNEKEIEANVEDKYIDENLNQQTQNSFSNKLNFKRDLERKLSNKTKNEEKSIPSTENEKNVGLDTSFTLNENPKEKLDEVKTPLSKTTNKEFMKDLYISKSALVTKREKEPTPVITRNRYQAGDTYSKTKYETNSKSKKIYEPQTTRTATDAASITSRFRDRFRSKPTSDVMTDRPTTSISERVLNRIKLRNELEESKKTSSLSSRLTSWTRR